MNLLRPRHVAIITAAAGGGLFLSHVLSEFIPDALGIMVGMSCFAFVAGVLVGQGKRP